MRIVLSSIFCLLTLLTACDEHELPDIPELVQFHLRLDYETDMTEWVHLYDGENVIEHGWGDTYDNHHAYGKIRYIVRAFPYLERDRVAREYTQEFVFTKDVSEGYNHEVTLELPGGDYKIMVWSDLQEKSHDNHFHHTADFAEIRLQGEHAPNTDHRDAFRGTNDITLISDIMERLPDTLDIKMQRPLAKFELRTTDVVEFIEKEIVRIASKANGDKQESGEDTGTRVVDIEDYKLVFYYVGFMPNAYSIHTDRPVDSATGVFFESSLKKMSDSEASMGFDYVFVNENESKVTIRVGVFDKEGEQLSITEPLAIPVRRDHHTTLTGMFLMSEASGGVTINPDYEGDHNLIFP